MQVSKDNTIVVASSSEEITVWKLGDSKEYIEIVSIEVFEDDAKIMVLSEEGHILAYTGTNLELTIWRITETECKPIKNIHLL